MVLKQANGQLLAVTRAVTSKFKRNHPADPSCRRITGSQGAVYQRSEGRAAFSLTKWKAARACIALKHAAKSGTSKQCSCVFPQL